MQQEQLAGTLESLLMTPTSPATIQVGAVVYDLIYIPIRTAVFLVVIALAFGLDFYASGLLPALVVLVVFIPFVWGLGVASAGATLTFRRAPGSSGSGLDRPRPLLRGVLPARPPAPTGSPRSPS